MLIVAASCVARDALQTGAQTDKSCRTSQMIARHVPLR
jgi:hypothetical protein